MYPSLWCIDVALAALSWGVLIAALFNVSLLTFGPLLVLFGLVWSHTLFSRVERALKGNNVMFSAYYKSHAFLMILLSLSAFAATLWLLAFEVGTALLPFFAVPIFIRCLGQAPFLSKIRYFKQLCMAAAFVFACAVPAYYYGFVYTLFGLISNPHLWCLVCLFFLFAVEREKPVNGHDGELAATWVPAGLLVLVIPCAYHAFFGNCGNYEQNFYSTICIGAVCLHLLSTLRAKYNSTRWFVLCWVVMMLPALLGILLFAPQTWF